MNISKSIKKKCIGIKGEKVLYTHEDIIIPTIMIRRVSNQKQLNLDLH